mgnify:CR=1 FL=1
MKFQIPTECLAYTEVFQTMRWEIFIALVAGLIIGMLVASSK